jgi:acid phosphatase
MPISYWGELTDLGRQSTLSLGSALRSLYVTQSSFLSPYLNTTVPREEAEVTFRSTGMNRTIESLHQVVEGLFPAGFRKGQNEGEEGRVDFVVRSWEQESLYPNGLCVYVVLLAFFLRLSSALRTNELKMNGLDLEQ